MNREYFIVGDFNVCGKIKSCLIRLCGTEERAKKTLPEIIANPPEGCLGNIRIESDDWDNCWWNQGGLD